MRILPTIVMLLAFSNTAASVNGSATEFCLEGEQDLAVRLQGMQPVPGEWSPARFCVTTETQAKRVRYHSEGHTTPDMQGSYTVAYLPPDLVRITIPDGADLEFQPVDMIAEAARHGRIDPRVLVAELEANPHWVVEDGDKGWRRIHYPGSQQPAEVRITAGQLVALRTTADLPLRGRVPVHWNWRWSAAGEPSVTIEIDGYPHFRGKGQWRQLSASEASASWQPRKTAEPVQIPGAVWPSAVNMRLETLADGVYFVRGVRTGFDHLVVDTGDGLVVGDAPAGWVEVLQLPPADLVPGLGISGLSEQFIDFLAEELPGRPIIAVALSHAHDDHAGGARAFAAAGATVYAPAGVAGFIESALNRDTMPADRLAQQGSRVAITPVENRVVLAGERNTVELRPLEGSPHVASALGMYAADAGYFFQSDLHVRGPNSAIPSARRARTECWFAAWATANLPAATIVIGTHGGGRTSVSEIASYLRGDYCENS